jgi:hypothetical protein
MTKTRRFALLSTSYAAIDVAQNQRLDYRPPAMAERKRQMEEIEQKRLGMQAQRRRGQRGRLR